MQRLRSGTGAALAAVVTFMGLATACGPSRIIPIHVLDAAMVGTPDGTTNDRAADSSVVPDVPPAAMDVAPDLEPEPPVAEAGVDTPIVLPDCPETLVGFATRGPGTTGGAGGTVVRATTLAQLIAYAEDLLPLVIEVDRMITITGEGVAVRVQSNKTIRGVARGAGLTGGGLLIKDVSNVIIQRLIIAKPRDKIDAIGINHSTNIWIDHCDLSTEPVIPDVYDGLVDITHAADFVTVSWNVFHDHKYTSLVGHSADAAAMAEDVGHLTVTYHHNWFRHTQYYNPRVRFGTVHVFNNFYEYDVATPGTAIVSQMGAKVLVEWNVFQNVVLPATTVYEDPQEGTMRAIENLYIDSGDTTIGQRTDWIPTYSYNPDPNELVRPLLEKCAGPQL